MTSLHTPSRCGPCLDRCRCQYVPGPRSATEIEARHRESVARAARSGWADLTPRLVDPTGRRWAA